MALFVGIDKYPGLGNLCGDNGQSSCELHLAVADANRLARAVGQSRLYQAVQSTVLADEKASHDAVLGRLDAIIASATAEDTIVVSFAGHGVRLDNKLGIVLSATVGDDIEGTSLPFEAVAARLKRALGRVIVMLDVCHAGVTDRLSTNDDAVAQLVTDNGSSMVILAASKGRQLSSEDSRAGGGRFSLAIDRILTRDRKIYDLDRNGAISIGELYRGIKANVVRDSQGDQTPWLSRNLMVGDFDIF